MDEGMELCLGLFHEERGVPVALPADWMDSIR